MDNAQWEKNGICQGGPNHSKINPSKLPFNMVSRYLEVLVQCGIAGRAVWIHRWPGGAGESYFTPLMQTVIVYHL